MNIRKKLTVASVLMVLIPVVVAVMLSFLLIFYKGDGMINRLKDLYENDNGLLNVQSILYQNKDLILSYEPLQENDLDEDNDDDEKQDDDDDDDDDDENDDENDDEKENIHDVFGKLENELKALGYYYQIQWNNHVIISNLPDGAEKVIASVAGSEYETIRNISVSEENISVVKRSYFDDRKEMEVLAYCDQYRNTTHSSQIIREIMTVIVFFLFVLLVTVVCSIFILTRWLSGGMRKSLDELSEGVRQIQVGNLSYRIHSRKKDELGKACDEFDEMAEYFEESVRQREQYEESRKQMLAGISHDLRTPLTSIKAYVEGLRDGIANTEEKKQKYYKALQTRTADLEALIDNLSLFSRFDRGEYHYSMEPVVLNEFLDNYFKENEMDFRENHLFLKKRSWTDVPLWISGDKKQLKRVLGNLVDNTIKYREQDETTLMVALYKKENCAYIELEDDGPGVPVEEREQIFETFYRGDEARQNPGNGSGLGLSIVREILKGHGAEIKAEAGEDGRGLKMIMKFPLKGENSYEENINSGR